MGHFFKSRFQLFDKISLLLGAGLRMRIIHEKTSNIQIKAGSSYLN